MALCLALGVSESGYYKHLRNQRRPPRHRHLLAQIKQCIMQEPENANYGVQRLFQWLVHNKGYAGS